MKNKELIGRKVRGFQFESHPNEFKLQYTVCMEPYINKTGVIKSYDEFLDAYCVLFEEGTDDEQSFYYPASEIQKYLIVAEFTTGDYRTLEQKKEEQDVLDKFAIATLRCVIEEGIKYQDIAKHAYGIARAMMKERSKNGN